MILLTDCGTVDGDRARRLLDEIAARLSPAHAAIFARPVMSREGGTDWHADGETMSPAERLDADSLKRLHRHAGSILSDIRRVAQAEGGMIRDGFAALPAFPERGGLFAVDGRPVIVGWGRADGGVPAWVGAYDDGRAPDFPRARRRPPALMRTAQIGSILGFALGAALTMLMPFDAACLETRDVAAWQAHDPRVVSGCWQRMTNLDSAENDVLTKNDYRLWQVCIDPDGKTGHLSVDLSERGQCTGDATARVEGDRAVIRTAACPLAGSTYLPRVLSCTHRDDDHIACTIHVVVADEHLPPQYRQGHEGLLQRVKPAIKP
ncbi:hypothetical protein Gdia_3215 [Gluconacetobacter diazotrophicus PA1 5]|uniref:Uncharacterized protein n=1 Tax=Gluconacetobacter diazotrophicus TaxID=33996 RepID=A0A7W4NHA8_GLUDI|nr:hypothetical protein [Gluconacetobacter diazotrophicus]ACI52945.1 hypothetical protein Gdia_3215 [Gluconacetobacter diazotrophicus PA1 5]MBB2157722.1 hypothetical protein [Gluconacetobacter diazotrophicus]TWB08910.1 hypothetical protein FBZ86_10510 [Gluconacetobacter diazotrophicus]